MRTPGRVVRPGGVHRRPPLWLRARGGPRQHHTARSRGGTQRWQAGVCLDRRRHASLDRAQGAGPSDAARRAGRSGEEVGSRRSGEGTARLQGLAASRLCHRELHDRRRPRPQDRHDARQRPNPIATALGRSSAPALPAPELRIVHALQPAPHFNGRDDLVQTLSAWVDDIASPDRVHALVAAGGTGKTAIAEQVVALLQQRWPPPGAGSVLVWSFYEKPDADAFVRECAQLFLGEADDSPAGGRLERLQRGLRDGRPHLIVLDGLERVQAEAGAGQVRGELEDHTLKLLLQAIAAGLGRTRALVTSRFPLTDLRDWQRRSVVETVLEDLAPDAARQVLRGWGVLGEDAQLDAVSAQVGRHALSVAVIGSYLSHFEGGRIEAAATLQLDAAAGDDPKAAKLARVLAFYAERLPAEERELLARLSVFPRGITLDVLGTLVDAGGQVAGVLVNAKPVADAAARAAGRPRPRLPLRRHGRHAHLDRAPIRPRTLRRPARLPGRGGVRCGGDAARPGARTAAGQEAGRHRDARPLRAVDRSDPACRAGRRRRSISTGTGWGRYAHLGHEAGRIRPRLPHPARLPASVR